MVNTNGNFTLNGLSKRVNSTDTFIVNIDSFSTTIYYSYQLDASPLDFLRVNGSQVPSQDCTQESAAYKCLRTNNIEFKTERCVSNYTIDLSYGYNEFIPYSLNDAYAPRVFTQNINLQCNNKLDKILKN